MARLIIIITRRRVVSLLIQLLHFHYPLMVGQHEWLNNCQFILAPLTGQNFSWVIGYGTQSPSLGHDPDPAIRFCKELGTPGATGIFNCFYGFVNIMTQNGLNQMCNLKRGDFILTNDGLQPLANLMVGYPGPMVKIPKDFFLPNVPNDDIYVSDSHPLSVKVISTDEDFEFKHIFVIELISLGLGYVELGENFVYNLMLDKHYEINVGGMKFLSHHPNHENGNEKLENPFNEKNRSKKNLRR